MTKGQAIRAMKKGYFIVHKFLPRPITMSGNNIVLSNGVLVPEDVFWENRTYKYWKKNYFLYQSPEETE